MAPATASKRSRQTAFNDGGDTDEHSGLAKAGPSSHSRRDTTKRARILEATHNKARVTSRRQRSADTTDQDEDDVETDDEADADDGDVAAFSRGPELPPATQYEMLRDDNFQHLKHSEEDDMRATQRLQKRHRQDVGENAVAENAVLESIVCVNFMCHTYLRCDLGPLLNFIVGENGSGKSAILTAITLCLGGKASSTNRGASLKSFIKEGQPGAVLMVKIKNRGSDAFKPDLYGDSITVERRMTTKGSSGFKVKSETGSTISTKRSEVEEIVEYFCLQVDNPLNVLSQDNAREFLNAASAAVKYRYFMQGTQLEQLSNDLQLLAEIIDQTEEKLVGYSEGMVHRREKYERAKTLQETARQMEKLRSKGTDCVKQLAWAQLALKEVELEERKNRLHLAEQDVLQMRQAIQEKTEAFAAFSDKLVQAKQAVEVLLQGEHDVVQQQTGSRAKYNEERATVEVLHTQERQLHEEFQQARANVQNFEQKIVEEERRIEEVNGGALAQRQQELSEAERTEERIQASLDEHQAAGPRLKDEYAEAEKEAVAAGKVVEQKGQECRETENTIRNITHERHDPLAGYERGVRRLLEEIERDNGYDQKPLGPYGLHMRLTKPKWGAVIESLLGKEGINAFLACSKRDQRRLQDSMDRLGVKQCPIHIRAPAPPLNQLREPDESFDTVLRVLNFDNTRIRDQVVITSKIEQILLIEKRVDAERVMFDAQPPPNVVYAASFHDNEQKRNEYLTFRNSGHGNLSTSFGQVNRRQSPRMKSDSDTQVSLLRETLAELKREHDSLMHALQSRQKQATVCCKAHTDHKKQLTKLEAALRRAGVAKLVAQEALDQFEDVGSKLQGLKSNLAQAQEAQDHFGRQYGDCQVNKQEQNLAVEAAKRAHDEARLLVQEFAARKAKADDRVKKLESLRQSALAEKNGAHANEAIAIEGKQMAERELGEKARDVGQDEANVVAQFGPDRVPLGDETIQSIEKKFERIKERIERFHRDNGANEKDINDGFQQAKKEWEDAKSNYEHHGSLLASLKEALTDRLRKWRYFQKLISANSRANFLYLLSERSFRGELILDHKNKKLEIKVEPDDTRKKVSGRSTKTLSGGEKSFASICMLLAIWEAMGSPLRCLDEFDVFMDNVNRTISTNMLIQTARRAVGKQFILITPNPIEGRGTVDRDVKIIRLTDPRQRLLPDMMADDA